MVTLRARYVVPVETEPIENGAIHIENGRLTAIESASRCSSFVDLGDVALLPAFVNAHTHLEFSDLEKPLGVAGTPFPDWIEGVVAHRRHSAQSDRVATVRRGVAESLAHGVTCLGDIVTHSFHPDVFRSSHLTGISFFELLGLADCNTERLVREAEAYISKFPQLPHLPGISPHAPYTISLGSLERLVALSVSSRVPVAMHLAESSEELALLQSKSGRLVELLENWGAWDPAVHPFETSPADYLMRLAQAHRSLVIHGNYLTKPEMELIAANGKRMSVVYCPRTHSYFGHRRYPLQEFLSAGVNVALGTDSRASNPNLSILEELTHTAATHPALAPVQVLRMATLNGARALGLDDRCGSLRVGKRADIVAIPMGTDSRDPLDTILAGDPQIANVYVAGQRVS